MIQENKEKKQNEEADLVENDEQMIVKEIDVVTVVDTQAQINTLKYLVVLCILIVLLAIAAVTLCYLKTCIKKNSKIDA